MGYLGLLLIGWVGLFLARRALWRRNKKRGKRRRGFYPTGASAGNALHALQVIAHPQEKYVLAEKLEEPAEEDDEAGPKDPTAHLMRQARRIRSGKEVERFTVLLPR
jgi:hypothetical protein